MNHFAEMLKYIIPSLVVGGTAVLTIKYFLDQEQKNRQSAWKDQNRSTVTPLRLQAYERVVLFLERISPASLIMRVNQPEWDARQLHRTLIQNIREEYEHNLSLQIYLSGKSWELVKSSKEELIMLINQSMTGLGPEAGSTELAQRIFENYLKTEKPPLTVATEYLRQEVSQLF